MTPEAEARPLIDDKLAQAGWVVQDLSKNRTTPFEPSHD